jgi:hypothetical protein
MGSTSADRAQAYAQFDAAVLCCDRHGDAALHALARDGVARMADAS